MLAIIVKDVDEQRRFHGTFVDPVGRLPDEDINTARKLRRRVRRKLAQQVKRLAAPP
jgi:hypothetical protein